MGLSDSMYDVVVIGAGSAGLAAARTASEEGLSVVLIEASHRIGGRAFTDTESLGFPFDLGCHWMNSASLNRHSPYTIQIRGNRTTFPPPRELYPLCSHPMA